MTIIQPSQPAATPAWRRVVGRRVVRPGLLALTLGLAVKFLGPYVLIGYDISQARRALAKLAWRDALDWLHAAQSRQPERAETEFLLGTVYRRSGLLRPAREHLERARALGYSPREVKRQELMLLFQMGDIGAAESSLTKMLARGGNDDMAEEIYEAMAVGYLTEHRAQEAATTLSHWIVWRPESMSARLLRVHLFGAMNDSNQLEAELREILRIDPGRIAQRLALVDHLRNKKQIEEAIAECEVCRKQAPDDHRVSVQLGLCHYELGQLDEARRELDPAATLVVDLGLKMQGLVRLGQLASDAKDWEGAVNYYTKAVQARPCDMAANYGLGLALSRWGKLELAERHLERSRVLSSQDERMDDINLLLVRDAENVELRLEAARILQDQGRKADAAAWMMSVLRHAPRRREAHEFLAEFYDEKGRADLAQRHRDDARTDSSLEAGR